MSWLLVTLDFPPAFVGGVAAWAHDLATALVAGGEAVTVLARATGDTAAHDARLPFEVVRMRGRSWGRWQGVWAAAHAVPRLRAGTRVVCATWPLATALAPFAGRLAIAFHGSDLTRLAAPAPGFLRATARAHALLPVSRFLAGELGRLGIEDHRVRVLPMPLRLPGSPPVERGDGLVVLSRLTPLKGVDRAVALAHALDLPLTVIGEGPAAPPPGPRVRLLGRLDREAALTRLAHARACVLLPRVDADGTGAEGLGLCLLEAQARGVPAIGCHTGGVPEATGAGLVLEDPDAPDLAAVRALLDDPTAPVRAMVWVAAHHGPERAVAALRQAMEDR